MRRVPRSRGGVHRRRALFAAYTRMCNNVHTFARVSVAFSLFLPFSLPRVSFPFLSGFFYRFGGVFFFFFFTSGFSSTTDRDASSPRVSSAHKRLYTSRLSCTHRAGNARVVQAGARSHRTERKEKKFEVEGSVARYSSTFGSGCQEALFTGFAAQRTINSARCRW